jgi:hypothetical protein
MWLPLPGVMNHGNSRRATRIVEKIEKSHGFVSTRSSQRTPNDFHSATSQEAYNNTMSPAAPTGLSHRADQYWSRNSPHLPFGNTYHSWFPTKWIRQTLGANINLTFAQHSYCSIHKNYTPQSRQTQPDPYPNTIGHSTMIRPAAYYESDSVDDRDALAPAACLSHPSYPTHSDDAPPSHLFLDI